MHTTPLLSIVIPTHKRPAILRQCLDHLGRQTIAEQIEVIVVNDADEWKVESGKWKVDLKIFNIPQCHQGTARNYGVQQASGKFVMFIGDDIFLAPDACEKHLTILNSQFSILNSTAVLGFTTWDPACVITPVMRWLERSGWQFGYPMISRFAHQIIPSSIQHKFTYTSHISLPTKIAKKFPFREDVTLYGWEDIEWGWRLKEAGVKLFYEPDAKALHHHHMTMEDSLKRMETLGRSAVVMEKLLSKDEAAFRRMEELAAGVVPRGWKRFKYQIALLLPGMRGAHARAFLCGIDGNR